MKIFNIKTLLFATTIIVMSACEKNPIHKQVFKKSTGENSQFPYEIYHWGESSVIEALEEGLDNLFKEENSTSTTEITKGIWLAETGLNYKYSDGNETDSTEYLQDFDESIELTYSVTFNLEESKIVNSDLKTAIEQASQGIAQKISEGYTHKVTDVKFMDLDGSKLRILVRTTFILNPVMGHSPYTYQVASAVDDKLLINAAKCSGAIIGISRAAEDAEDRLYAALPRAFYVNYSKLATNVVAFSSTKGVLGRKYLEAEFLPGLTQSLHHPMPAKADTCLIVSEQNDYTQAISDLIALELGKFTFWDGVAWLDVVADDYNNHIYGLWYFNLDLAWWAFYNPNQSFTPPF